MESASYRFDGFYLDRPRMLLTRDGQPVPLEPKALDVLLFLIDRRDRLVTKEELLDAIWKDTFVTPNVLTREIAQLRKALDDDAGEPRVIETAARRGYRFIAAITETTVAPGFEPPPAAPAAAAAAAGVLPPARRTAGRPVWLWAAAVGVLVVGAATATWFASRGWHAGTTPGPVLVPKRLSTRAGYESRPVLSPDGRSLAFVSDRTGALEIYVRALATGTEFVVTADGGQNTDPAWSLDAAWLAFHSVKRGGIWIVPATGGQPQQIVDFGSQPSWGPGDQIAFTSESGGFNEQARLCIVGRDGSGLREITNPSQTPGGALAPSWSHNGKLIAFTSGAPNVGGSDIKTAVLILSMTDLRLHEISQGPFQGHPVFGAGDGFLYWTRWGLSDPALVRARVNPDTGDRRGGVETLLPMSMGADTLSIAPDGTLAYSVPEEDANLWRMDLAADGTPGPPVRITNDAVRDTHPAYGPDGRLVYQQVVPGRDVTVRVGDDRAVTEPLLTGQPASDPQWSSDATRVWIQQKDKSVWVDLTTRRTAPLPIPMDRVSFPRLSPDDRTLAYHRIDPDGIMRVWTRPLDGGAERLVAEDRGGVGFPVWSPDGTRLAVEMKRGDRTVFGVVPATGGSVTEIVTDRGNSWPNAWSPDGTRIAYAGQRDGVWNIFEVTVATKVSRALTRYTLPIGYLRYPTWSPKGDRIIFERAIHKAAIWTAKVE